MSTNRLSAMRPYRWRRHLHGGGIQRERCVRLGSSGRTGLSGIRSSRGGWRQSAPRLSGIHGPQRESGQVAHGRTGDSLDADQPQHWRLHFLTPQWLGRACETQSGRDERVAHDRAQCVDHVPDGCASRTEHAIVRRPEHLYDRCERRVHHRQDGGEGHRPLRCTRLTVEDAPAPCCRRAHASQ